MRIGTDPPIPGAEIFFDNVLVGLTGTDGSLTIAEVAAGPHTIRAHKDGYEDASETISVPETTSVTLTLTLITYKVAVVTILPGSSIYVDGNYVGETKLDPLLIGMLMVEVSYGTHEFKATRSGFRDAVRIVDVTSDMTVELIQEPLTYTIVVTVQGSGPIEGATVSLDGYAVGVTGADGTLAISNVTAGLHAIEAGKIGYESDLKYITVPETTGVTLALRPLVYTVVVTVTGSQISGASIYLDGSYVGATDAAGRLTIPNVTAGPHTIRASKSGYYDASATISVPETTSVTLTLSPVPPPPPKIKTEVRISSDKTTYTVGETARLTQGLYDAAGKLISGRVVDYNVTRDGVWYAGWGQYSDDPSRGLLLNTSGTYVITGSFPGDGTYESSSKAITITATAAPPPDFSISVSPTSGSVEQGQFTSTTVFVTGYGGFSSTVNLSVSGLPSGASVVFSKSSGIPDFQSGLRISTSSTTPTGTYVITVRGYGGGLTRTCTYTLTVTAPPPKPPTGYLYGYVVSAYTGYLIPGATVTCAGKSTTSDFSGYYMLTDLPTGAQTLTASASGYRPYSESITILAGPNYKYIGMIRV